MEVDNSSENHLISAAAFVEGGIQEACDDTCSICLEIFCDSDPSTVTSCKHEFHLQCILEWCQRSSQCPMCWQAITLKDPSSQELLDAVEHERNIRKNPPRNTTIFHHPTLGDFELQHLPVNASESDLEERIIQHLAAAAAMRRARQLARREGQRSRPSTQGYPQFLVYSTNPNTPSAASSADQVDGIDPPTEVMIAAPNSSLFTVGEDSVQAYTVATTASGSNTSANQHGTSPSNRRSPSSPSSQDRAGPSDFQSFSESLKSRVSALSMRYKESITKSTRGWKERLFNRNSSTADPTSEVRRDVEQNIPTAEVHGEIDHQRISTTDVRRQVDHSITPPTISIMMDHLQIAENDRKSILTTQDP